MASTKLWLYRRTGSQTLHSRKCFASVSDMALKWDIIIERVTYELRERETRCNARTLNTGKLATNSLAINIFLFNLFNWTLKFYMELHNDSLNIHPIDNVPSLILLTRMSIVSPLQSYREIFISLNKGLNLKVMHGYF